MKHKIRINFFLLGKQIDLSNSLIRSKILKFQGFIAYICWIRVEWKVKNDWNEIRTNFRHKHLFNH